VRRVVGHQHSIQIDQAEQRARDGNLAFLVPRGDLTDERTLGSVRKYPNRIDPDQRRAILDLEALP
jgi:hypothetical protein